MSPSIVASGGHSWDPPGKKPPPGPPWPPCGPCMRKSSMRPSECVTVPAPVIRSKTIALPPGSVNEHVLVSSSTVPSGGQPGAPPGPPGPPSGPPISFMLKGSTLPSARVTVPSIVSRLKEIWLPCGSLKLQVLDSSSWRPLGGQPWGMPMPGPPPMSIRISSMEPSGFMIVPRPVSRSIVITEPLGSVKEQVLVSSLMSPSGGQPGPLPPGPPGPPRMSKGASWPSGMMMDP